ncbi:MAG TPA: hypothetical protein VM581_00140 [Magnetospirillaceae bacterium]|nr:hypothetical protein [Magnetospirillaceae bacterium]
MTSTRKVVVTFGMAAAAFVLSLGTSGAIQADGDMIQNHGAVILAGSSLATPAGYGTECISDGVKGNATPAGGCGNATPAYDYDYDYDATPARKTDGSSLAATPV